MFSIVLSSALHGIDGYIVKVEIDIVMVTIIKKIDFGILK